MPAVSANATCMDFRETSFFTNSSLKTELPSPSAVLERNEGREGIVVYQDLQLVVKVGLGREVNLVQALSMRFVREAFPDHEVPVPEVFGWRVCEPRVFIYMELIPGQTAMDLWPGLTEPDKQCVAEQISNVVSNLKRLRQRSRPPIIGMQSLYDLYDRTKVCISD